MKYRLRDNLLAPFQIAIAALLVAILLLLPYAARAPFVRGVAFAFHLPFYVFGRVATFLFRRLDIDPKALRE